MTIDALPLSPAELPEELVVWRPAYVEDEGGGRSVVLVQGATVRAKVSQPTAAEQIEAAQAGSAMTMIVHMTPDTDVRRGDELRRSDGDKLRVRYTIHASRRTYLRADCEQIQPEGQLE